MTPAVVCGHPSALAASSHSAWLPTHASPLLSVHNPDVRASNPFAAFANVLQVLIAATQNIPVVLAVSQSADPQRQLPSFSDVPSAMLHDATVGREQVLAAAVQTRPVPCPSPLLVHALFPQMQRAALLGADPGADPSVFVQAEAVTPEA